MLLQAKLTALAAALRENREDILADWLGTLRIGMEKPGAVLTDAELRDHFADLLEDLCNQLEVPLTETSEISALKHAEIHGDMRWMQAYKLPELIREVAALRTVVVAAVVAHGHSRLDVREQSLANIIIHRFFDALVVESASFFATLSEDAIVLHEREQLAQELHDSASQSIQGTLLILAAMRRQIDPASRGQLDDAVSTLGQGLNEIRAVVQGLVSLVSHIDHGLRDALEKLAAETSRFIPCAFECAADADVSRRQAFQLFWIAHEAVQNAREHAGALRTIISLGETGDTLHLGVRDDGRGFDAANQRGIGTGLHKMQQRARAIGASLKVESQPGAGTTITCILPRADAARAVPA